MEELNYPSEKNGRKIEKNNLTIIADVLSDVLYLAHVTKINSNRQKEVTIFMIPNRGGCDNLAVILIFTV